MTGCRDDIEAFCAEEKTKLRGNATVLRCLVANFDKTGAQEHVLDCFCVASAPASSCWDVGSQPRWWAGWWPTLTRQVRMVLCVLCGWASSVHWRFKALCVAA